MTNTTKPNYVVAHDILVSYHGLSLLTLEHVKASSDSWTNDSGIVPHVGDLLDMYLTTDTDEFMPPTPSDLGNTLIDPKPVTLKSVSAVEVALRNMLIPTTLQMANQMRCPQVHVTSLSINLAFAEIDAKGSPYPLDDEVDYRVAEILAYRSGYRVNEHGKWDYPSPTPPTPYVDPNTETLTVYSTTGEISEIDANGNIVPDTRIGCVEFGVGYDERLEDTKWDNDTFYFFDSLEEMLDFARGCPQALSSDDYVHSMDIEYDTHVITIPMQGEND